MYGTSLIWVSQSPIHFLHALSRRSLCTPATRVQNFEHLLLVIPLSTADFSATNCQLFTFQGKIMSKPKFDQVNHVYDFELGTWQFRVEQFMILPL